MVEIILYILVVLTLSFDGFVAIYRGNQRRKREIDELEIEALFNRAYIMEWPEELHRLTKLGKAQIPVAVLRRRGYTTRGNQLISRDAWAPLTSQIDKRIERIIRQ